MRKSFVINNLLKNREFTTKIQIYFSTKSAGDDFDSYEKNYTYTNQNPITIKGIVTQLRASELVWKGYGLKEQGSVAIICEKRYKNYFLKANKIEIDGNEYQVFKEGTGSRSIISDRPFQLIRVILQRA